MPSTSGSSASYRSVQRHGPDPVTEADVIADLMRLTTALRRKLLAVTIFVSFGGGIGAAALYVSVATEVYGRVCGAFFAAGAILTFALVHRISGLVARVYEARWIASLARHHALEPGPLAEALAMFKS